MDIIRSLGLVQLSEEDEAARLAAKRAPKGGGKGTGLLKTGASVYEDEHPAFAYKKDRQPNWKDTNMSFFGTVIEKKIKEAAANTEPQWKTAGKKEGLQIWRIEQFKVVPWPAEQLGEFHRDDSYIVLHTYMEVGESLCFSIHFWIGSGSSQDKYGTAAYKTVELDDYLKGAAVQHREVEGHESALFLSYFPNGIKYLEGGTESGFHHVEPLIRTTTLLQLKGMGNHVRLWTVDVDRASMNSGDVFILDCEEGIFQWNGKDSNGYERAKGAEVCSTMRAERGRSLVTVLEEGEPATFDPNSAFCKYLPTGMMSARSALDANGFDKTVRSAAEGGEDIDIVAFPKCIHRVTVTDKGAIQLQLVAQGYIPQNTHLKSEGVFVIDSGFAIFLWVGNQATVQERIAVFFSAQQYVVDRERPQCLPVTWYAEGQETHQFWRNFPDPPPLADNSKITNNYDKYASSYIDVDTNSCVTPSTAWERRIPRSLYAAHEWAMSEWIAAGLGDRRLNNIGFGELKAFIEKSGMCEQAELNWARTKFALVVLTEVKTINLTALLDASGPRIDGPLLDDRYNVAHGADADDAEAARQQALAVSRHMSKTAVAVKSAAQAAKEKALAANEVEKADLHAELAALHAETRMADIKAADRAIREREKRADAEAKEAADAEAMRRAEREARSRAALAAAAQKRANDAARQSERIAREARERANEARRRAEEAASRAEAEARQRAEAEARAIREEQDEEDRQRAERDLALKKIADAKKSREELAKLGRHKVSQDSDRVNNSWRNRRKRINEVTV